MRIEVRNLSVRYGSSTAIEDLSFTLEGGKIYGLLGRNGAGKTSLLSVLSAFRKANAGEIRINGQNPFENAAITRDICVIRDRVDAEESDRVERVLEFARGLRPNWDGAYAEKLVRLFNLPLRKKVSALSRGMKSALGQGITRRHFSLGAAAFFGPAAAIFGHLVLAGYGLEYVSYTASGQLDGPGDAYPVTSVGDAIAVLISVCMIFLAWTCVGWLIGAGFYRFGTVLGIAFIPVASIPALATEVAFGSWFLGVDDALSVPTGGLTVAVWISVAFVAVGLVGAFLIVRDVAIRTVSG